MHRSWRYSCSAGQSLPVGRRPDVRDEWWSPKEGELAKVWCRRGEFGRHRQSWMPNPHQYGFDAMDPRETLSVLGNRPWIINVVNSLPVLLYWLLECFQFSTEHVPPSERFCIANLLQSSELLPAVHVIRSQTARTVRSCMSHGKVTATAGYETSWR